MRLTQPLASGWVDLAGEMGDDERMKKERDFAVDLAKQAGAVMRANFSPGMKKEWKEDRSPLTVTDTAINRMVIAAVQKTFPEHSVLGEEESTWKEGDEMVWVCDPVDGTIPFSHGIPLSMFALALVRNGPAPQGSSARKRKK